MYRTLLIPCIALLAAGCTVYPLTPAPIPAETESARVALQAGSPAAATPTPAAMATIQYRATSLALTASAAAFEPTATIQPTPSAEPLILDVEQPPTAVPSPTTVPSPVPVLSEPTPVPPTAIPLIVVAPPPSADVAAAEQYTIDLINQQRAIAGVPPLARDETLMSIARARVADMVARGYTGHNDPVTGEHLAKSMMRAAGYGNYVGENWYGSINTPPAIVDIAMAWFMTDPPHYRNILSPNYTSVGIGIAYNGRQWLLVQNFGGQ